MTKHELKILPEYFSAVAKSLKTFEIRKNDRNYQVGDLLELKEWNDRKFTGDSVLMQVTYITDYAQKDNYVVMGIKSPRADSVVTAENEHLEETMAIIRENERLRTQVGTDFFRYGELTTAYEEVAEENKRLRDENKKLQKAMIEIKHSNISLNPNQQLDNLHAYCIAVATKALEDEECS